MKRASATPTTVRSVIFATPDGATPYTTSVYAREALPPGVTLAGPAIVTQYDTTTVLPPGWHARVDAVGDLIAEHP